MTALFCRITAGVRDDMYEFMDYVYGQGNLEGMWVIINRSFAPPWDQFLLNVHVIYGCCIYPPIPINAWLPH